jgi:hypothetical protein
MRPAGDDVRFAHEAALSWQLNRLKRSIHRANLVAAWESGWSTLFNTLANLIDADLQKTVHIRGEEHTVHQALLRSLAHVAYHTGQIVYLSRLMQKEGWEWITIAPGQSRQFNEAMYAQKGKYYLG